MEHPSQEGGEYIAQGWRGALVQVRGDWELLANHLGMPSWSHKANMCWLCQASGDEPGRLWHDMGPSAGWRLTKRTHGSFVQELEEQGCEVPPIFSLFIGMNLMGITIDMLHAVDQGVTSHLIGNIFMICIERNVWGTGLYQKSVEELETEMKDWCKAAKVDSRIRGHLSLDRLRSKSGYPKLKAKAAATRHLIGFALSLARRHCKFDLRIIAVAQLMQEFYALVHKEGMYMSAESRARVAKIGGEFCSIYAQLARSALEQKQKNGRRLRSSTCSPT